MDLNEFLNPSSPDAQASESTTPVSPHTAVSSNINTGSSSDTRNFENERTSLNIPSSKQYSSRSNTTASSHTAMSSNPMSTPNLDAHTADGDDLTTEGSKDILTVLKELEKKFHEKSLSTLEILKWMTLLRSQYTILKEHEQNAVESLVKNIVEIAYKALINGDGDGDVDVNLDEADEDLKVRGWIGFWILDSETFRNLRRKRVPKS